MRVNRGTAVVTVCASCRRNTCQICDTEMLPSASALSYASLERTLTSILVAAIALADFHLCRSATVTVTLQDSSTDSIRLIGDGDAVLYPGCKVENKNRLVSSTAVYCN